MGSIDVVVPNYNYGNYLKHAVASIQAQEVDNLRILIVDNASTDNSVEIAQELRRNDPRIEIVARQKNKGLHASFNEGIDWAQSDYFFILHADDISAPGSLKRAIGVLERHPDTVFTYGTAIRFSDDVPPPEISDTPKSGWSFESGKTFIRERCRSAHNPVACCAAILRTDAQKAAGHYDSRHMVAPDLEMWLRVATYGDVAVTDEVQGFYRVHNLNASAGTRERLGPELIGVREAFESYFDIETRNGKDVESLRQLVHQSIAERAYWAGIAHGLRGSFAGGWELLSLAVKEQPRTAILPPVNYMFRRKGALQRAGQVFSESKRRWLGSRGPTTQQS